MTGTRVPPPDPKTGVRRRRASCRECGRPDPMLTRAGLCRACERARREAEAREAAEEHLARPAEPPEDLFGDSPPADLFDDE